MWNTISRIAKTPSLSFASTGAVVAWNSVLEMKCHNSTTSTDVVQTTRVVAAPVSPLPPKLLTSRN